MSDRDFVYEFLNRAEEFYGPRFPCVTFELQETPPQGHWTRIGIPPQIA
jgi:hypothetical protein